MYQHHSVDYKESREGWEAVIIIEGEPVQLLGPYPTAEEAIREASIVLQSVLEGQ